MNGNNYYKLIAALIVCAVVSFFAGVLITNAKNEKEIRWLKEANATKRSLITAYESYYDATEEFLNILDDRYDWVDAYDYEPYYVAVELIDNIYKQEQ